MNEIEQKRLEMEWLASGDTGTSSKTILGAITGIYIDWQDVPADISDIGRCVRMLRKLPHLRPQLEKVIIKHPKWMPFIDCWKELEKLYDECVDYQKLSEEDKGKLKKKKYYETPNDTAWDLIQQLEAASKYLSGMRIQNYSNSWANKKPESF